jgi:hypothetical protein
MLNSPPVELASHEDTPLFHLTEQQLRAMIQDIVRAELKDVMAYIYELEAQIPDPDAGKALRPEVQAQLRMGSPKTIPHAQLKQDLGLDE